MSSAVLRVSMLPLCSTLCNGFPSKRSASSRMATLSPSSASCSNFVPMRRNTSGSWCTSLCSARVQGLSCAANRFYPLVRSCFLSYFVVFLRNITGRNRSSSGIRQLSQSRSGLPAMLKYTPASVNGTLRYHGIGACRDNRDDQHGQCSSCNGCDQKVIVLPIERRQDARGFCGDDDRTRGT